MITINELRKALNRIAPEESAESWDNCGFQINTGRENYSRILVCLEITKAVIEEAKEKKAELIITTILFISALSRKLTIIKLSETTR